GAVETRAGRGTLAERTASGVRTAADRTATRIVRRQEDTARIRIEQHLAGIEPQALRRVERAIDAVAVIDRAAYICARHPRVPDAAAFLPRVIQGDLARRG